MKTVIFISLVGICTLASLLNAYSKAGKIKVDFSRFSLDSLNFRHHGGRNALAK